MKKILITTLGTIATVATPVLSTVSCGLGSIFKTKIYSAADAERDIKKIVDDIKDDAELGNNVLTYTEYATLHSLNEHVGVESNSTLTKDSWKGISLEDSQLSKTEFIDGRKVWGFSDWTGSHGYLFSLTPVSLKDGSDAKILIMYRYEKTHGGYTGRTWSTIAWNAIASARNAAYKWQHEISDVVLVNANADENTINSIFPNESRD